MILKLVGSLKIHIKQQMGKRGARARTLGDGAKNALSNSSSKFRPADCHLGDRNVTVRGALQAARENKVGKKVPSILKIGNFRKGGVPKSGEKVAGNVF